MACIHKQAMNGIQTTIQHAISQNGVAVLGLQGDVAIADIEDVFFAGKKFNHYTIHTSQYFARSFRWDKFRLAKWKVWSLDYVDKIKILNSCLAC